MTTDLVKRANKVLAPVLGHYTEAPISHGKGCYLYGPENKKYLDFAAGIAVNATGHCHQLVSSAIAKQANKLIHACAGVVYYEPNIALAEKLSEITPFNNAKTFFTNSGSEAVEGALKLARYVTGKKKLVALKQGFHGRTFGALSLTSSNMKYQQGYDPILPDTIIIEKNIESLEKLPGAEIAAIILEPIQGEGGYIPLDKDFLAAIRDFCDKNNILLIFDEIQSGVGRTGQWFACNHFGIKPDVLLLAKGIASGMPLGAIIADASIMDKWDTGAHGGTYTGNPVACAAALATIEVIEKENLLENATQQGAFLLVELQKLQSNYPHIIKEVRGLGLMIGVEFFDLDIVKTIRQKSLEQGLIVISCGAKGQVIRLCPPLIVTTEQSRISLEILKRALVSQINNPNT